MAYGYLDKELGFTVEGWFYRTAAPTVTEAIFAQYTQNPSVRWAGVATQINGRQTLCWLENDTISYQVRNDNGTVVYTWTDATGGSYTSDSQWHHFAVRLRPIGFVVSGVTLSQQKISIWLDGVLKVNEAAPSQAINWAPGTLVFAGGYAPYLGNWGGDIYTGGLAYIAVFDRPLTDDRILEHYAAGNGGAVWAGDDEVTRLGRLYDIANVPECSRQFDSAVTTLQGVQITGQRSLEKVLDTAEDAGGMVFADGQSTLVYQNRRHKYNRTILQAFGEGNSGAPETGWELATDETHVVNDAHMSRLNAGSSQVRDLSSQAEFGVKSKNVELTLTSDDEVYNAGTWLVSRYATDMLRVDGVTLRAESSAIIEKLMSVLNLGELIVFEHLPDNVPSDYFEFIVEAIDIDADFKAQTWELGLALSPNELNDVFQVGATVLCDGSRIAF